MTAEQLRPGDRWSWYSQGYVQVTAIIRQDDGMVSIIGQHDGRGRSHTWKVPASQPVELARMSA